MGNLPLEHHFHEFQVNTELDLEDLMDIFKTNDDIEGLPDPLTDSESEYNPSESESDEDRESDNFWDPDDDVLQSGKEREAPQQAEAQKARKDLQKLLRPPRKAGVGTWIQVLMSSSGLRWREC